MTRFLYVGNHAGYFLTHRLPVMQALQAIGYEVHVAVPAEPDSLAKMVSQNAVGEIRDRGFHVHPISLRRGSMGIWGELRAICSLYRVIKDTKPDIIYQATLKPVIYGGLIMRFTHHPVTISAITGLGYVFVSSDTRSRLLRGILSQVFRIVLAHPNIMVLFQNHDDRDLFVERRLIPVERAYVIKGSGVDITKYQPVPEPEELPVVVLPSRMIWDKGIGEFVEAARNVRLDGIQARFVLVGDSDPENPRSVTKEQLQAWHDEGVVEWWGWRQDIPMILREAHIVCLPSYREGVPKILIEAAATGRAIVTCDVPGCREIVRPGENGLLVPPQTVKPLEKALCELIGDPDLRQAMGLRGREIVEKEFSSEIIVANTLEIISNQMRRAKE